jgi:hypothetical protein
MKLFRQCRFALTGRFCSLRAAGIFIVAGDFDLFIIAGRTTFVAIVVSHPPFNCQCLDPLGWTVLAGVGVIQPELIDKGLLLFVSECAF